MLPLGLPSCVHAMPIILQRSWQVRCSLSCYNSVRGRANTTWIYFTSISESRRHCLGPDRCTPFSGTCSCYTGYQGSDCSVCADGWSALSGTTSMQCLPPGQDFLRPPPPPVRAASFR